MINSIEESKINGTKRSNIKIGAAVLVVQKQDQHTGKLTEGIVKKILTNSPEHHHGIKVMLESDIVGRVKEVK
ncbi:YwbE family protein [Cellulosilyticum sp. I15G10I2]|uniref:YwbE family protein n=1 Tax=Cellulosilyticum sp. I15G10I2 TaxID=1892843 RepID=UPI002E8DDDF8|nr:YwbE family protein [Cellulosilyticum sp. I15G10I2]